MEISDNKYFTDIGLEHAKMKNEPWHVMGTDLPPTHPPTHTHTHTQQKYTLPQTELLPQSRNFVTPIHTPPPPSPKYFYPHPVLTLNLNAFASLQLETKNMKICI